LEDVAHEGAALVVPHGEANGDRFAMRPEVLPHALPERLPRL
jgi:hypothetical protein